MNKLTQILTMSGLAVIAGATIGAAPAMAADSTSPTRTTAVTAQAGDRVVHFYRNRMQCERAGRVGEWLGRWDDHDCNRVWWGPRRGWYALNVQWNFHGTHHGGPIVIGGGHDNGDWHGHHDNGPWHHGR